MKAMRQGVAMSAIKVDVRASLMKPLNVNWLMCAISTLSDKPNAIKKQFETVGIYSTVDHKHFQFFHVIVQSFEKSIS